LLFFLSPQPPEFYFYRVPGIPDFLRLFLCLLPRTGLGADPPILAGALALVYEQSFWAATFSPAAAAVPVFAVCTMANDDRYSLCAKRNRGRIESNPGLANLAFHLGNTPKGLIPASGSKNRRVCQKYAKFLRRVLN
jgi:hypothetical protein